MASRKRNEKKFRDWEELPNGGRCYFRDFTVGPADALATIKEVDAAEQTIRFAREIHDSTGRLIAVHEKFPVDLGHKKL